MILFLFTSFAYFLHHKNPFNITDTHDINGLPILTIETKILMDSGLNCYEVATLILYYNTIPTKLVLIPYIISIPLFWFNFTFLLRCSSTKFALHIIVSESHQLSVLNLLDNAFNLLTGHVHIEYVLVSTLFASEKLKLQLPSSKIRVCNLKLKWKKKFDEIMWIIYM